MIIIYTPALGFWAINLTTPNTVIAGLDASDCRWIIPGTIDDDGRGIWRSREQRAGFYDPDAPQLAGVRFSAEGMKLVATLWEGRA